MVDISQWPGDTCKTLVLLLTLASHTHLEMALFPTVFMENAKIHPSMLNTNANQALLLKLLLQLKSRLKSMLMDLWKLPSLCTQTS